MLLCVISCQVSQLYDVVQKWDAMSTSIPQVVQRLITVKELHEQGENEQELELVHGVGDEWWLCFLSPVPRS